MFFIRSEFQMNAVQRPVTSVDGEYDRRRASARLRGDRRLSSHHGGVRVEAGVTPFGESAFQPAAVRQTAVGNGCLRTPIEIYFGLVLG